MYISMGNNIILRKGGKRIGNSNFQLDMENKFKRRWKGKFSSSTPLYEKKCEKRSVYKKLIIILREIVNKRYQETFREAIEKGAFTNKFDFFKDIEILSDQKTPFEVQKDILMEILPKVVLSLKKEDLEQICDNLNLCDPIIRSRIFLYFFCSLFNEKIEIGKNIDLKEKIYFFKNERIINKLKKFNAAYNKNEIAFNKILNDTFKITNLFKPEKFEYIFTKCLDIIIKYNPKDIKTSNILKGKRVIKCIFSIMKKYKEDEELFKRLKDLAIRIRKRRNIKNTIRQLAQNAQTNNRDEIMAEIKLILEKEKKKNKINKQKQTKKKK